jgi:hypothetical protein
MKPPSTSHHARRYLLAFTFAASSTLALAQESFDTLVKRLAEEKPKFAERHQKLLDERYDLADKPAEGVTMAKGKAVQSGVRVKLPKGTTW